MVYFLVIGRWGVDHAAYVPARMMQWALQLQAQQDSRLSLPAVAASGNEQPAAGGYLDTIVDGLLLAPSTHEQQQQKVQDERHVPFPHAIAVHNLLRLSLHVRGLSFISRVEC